MFIFPKRAWPFSFRSLKEKFFLGNNDNDEHIFIDCLNFFDDLKETIFFDKNHVADKGQKILAEKICSKIIEKKFL